VLVSELRYHARALQRISGRCGHPARRLMRIRPEARSVNSKCNPLSRKRTLTGAIGNSYLCVSGVQCVASEFSRSSGQRLGLSRRHIVVIASETDPRAGTSCGLFKPDSVTFLSGAASRAAPSVLAYPANSFATLSPFDRTLRLRQFSEYSSRYRLLVDRQEIGHCCRWFNDMTVTSEDPIAVIQWPVEFVDRGRCRGNRMLSR
jgi:hypothetical protein